MESLSSSMSKALAGNQLSPLRPPVGAVPRSGLLPRQRLFVRSSLSSQAGRAVQGALLQRDGKKRRTSVIALISEAVWVNVSTPFPVLQPSW